MSTPDAGLFPKVEGLTVGARLRATAGEFPDRDAMVFPGLGRRWTWSELDRWVDSVASGLIGLGVERGKHVGIWSMNAPEWVVLQFAVGRIGAVLVNINPAYRLHELEDALRAADVETLVVGSPFKGSNFVEMVGTLCPDIAERPGDWSSQRLPTLRRVVAIGGSPAPGWIGWDELEAHELHPLLAAREAGARPGDVYNIQFTSGTTGLPKGAMLTHANVLNNACAVGDLLRCTERDRICVPVPFYHCFGCVLGTLVCVVAGAAIVVPAPSFDAAATLAAVSRERCTALYGVPTMFVAALEKYDPAVHDVSQLRTGIMAGSPCPLPLMNEMTEVLNAREMTIGYGQTEASPIITMTSVEDPVAIRVGTVGRPIPGVEVKLVDPATRRDVAPDQPGELCTRGHHVMAGYYRNPEATARAVDADGWLHTGDLARRGDDGTYRIVGRCKEIIIRGGENVYPPEVEEFLHGHPGISEAAVVGLPDARYGEEISAWVVPRQGANLTPEEVRDFCRGQIAHYKVPHYVAVVPELPRTVTGKVRKHILRERGIADYGLEAAERIPTA